MVKEALHERANLLEIAPHLSAPLPIMLPVYKYESDKRKNAKACGWNRTKTLYIYLTLFTVLISKMVAVALLLGRDQDVRLGGRDPEPEEQLRPQ